MIPDENELETGKPKTANLLDNKQYPVLAKARRYYVEHNSTMDALLLVDPELSLDVLLYHIQRNTAIAINENNPSATLEATKKNGALTLQAIDNFVQNQQHAEPAALEYMLKSGNYFIEELLEVGISTYLGQMANGEKITAPLQSIITFCAQVNLAKTLQIVGMYSYIEKQIIVDGIWEACKIHSNVLPALRKVSKSLYKKVCARFVADPTVITDHVIEELMIGLRAQTKRKEKLENMPLMQLAESSKWLEKSAFKHLQHDSILFTIAEHLRTALARTLPESEVQKQVAHLLKLPLIGCIKNNDKKSKNKWRRKELTTVAKNVLAYYRRAVAEFGVTPIDRYESWIRIMEEETNTDVQKSVVELQQLMGIRGIPDYLFESLTNEFLAVDVHTRTCIISTFKELQHEARYVNEREIPSVWNIIFMKLKGGATIDYLPTNRSFPLPGSEESAYANLLLATSGQSEETALRYL
jgi:hypothetical protein